MAEVVVEDVKMGEEAAPIAEGSTTEKTGDVDIKMSDGDDKEKMLRAAKQSEFCGTPLRFSTAEAWIDFS